MCEDWKKTLPLGLLHQHSVLFSDLDLSLFSAYISSTQFKKQSFLLPGANYHCSLTKWGHLFFSVGPGLLAVHHFYTAITSAIFTPLCRDSWGTWIRRPWCRTSCPTPWELVSCASSLATGTPAAGWASEWRCTAAPTVSNTHAGETLCTIQPHHTRRIFLCVCAYGFKARHSWWREMRTISFSLGFNACFL